MHLTNTVLDKNTRPPQLCCSYQQTSRWDSTRGSPPDRTVCVAVDLSAAFDTVCHNNLLSKINRSSLPPATSRWLSSYLRGRQAKTCFRGVKSASRKVHTGVPQCLKLSSSLFSFYIADIPTPTEPVKRVCYADDLTVWATGVNIGG